MKTEKYTLFRSKFPLIQLFEYRDEIFAYDSKSNLLVEVSDEDLNNLQHVLLQDVHSDNQYIKFHNRGVLTHGGVNKITPTDDGITDMVTYNLSHVIPRKFMLEVTQNCNLRCRYCYFSDEESNRHHQNVHMSEVVAKKAIDYYFKVYTESIRDLSDADKEKYCKIAVPTLSWWGGEPFLNFGLIKWTKAYFEALP